MSNEEYWITHEATRELNRAYRLMRDYDRKVLLNKHRRNDGKVT